MNSCYLHQLPEEWEPKARIFAALGDATRQKILLLFEANETITLKTLVEVLPLSRSAVVHHITVLEQAGLLIARRQGREVGYILNSVPLITSLEDVLEYAQKFSDKSGVPQGTTQGTTHGMAQGMGQEAATIAAPMDAQTAKPISSSRVAPAEGSDALAAESFESGSEAARVQGKSLFVPLSAQELAHD